MKCRACDCEMRIISTGTRVEGDESPDTTTMVYSVQQLACRNPDCPECGKVQQTVEHRIL